MYYRFKNNKRWYRKAAYTDCLNYCYLFSVPWLRSSRPTSPIRACNYLRCSNHTYLEARLVEVVYIRLLKPILRVGSRYTPEPASQKRRIFAFCSLVIVLAVVP
jgi:hypothetical protein